MVGWCSLNPVSRTSCVSVLRAGIRHSSNMLTHVHSLWHDFAPWLACVSSAQCLSTRAGHRYRTNLKSGDMNGLKAHCSYSHQSCRAFVRCPGGTSGQLSASASSHNWRRNGLFFGRLGGGDINRWGPSAWATLTIWHDLGIIAEGHSMIMGGNQIAQNYKYFAGGGGLIFTSRRWGRFQPFVKGEAGYASLSHPDNGTGHFHDTSNIWTLGGGAEYHTWQNWWTRVEYSYDFFPDFHSGITNTNNTLSPRGFTFGETYRFGWSSTRF